MKGKKIQFSISIVFKKNKNEIKIKKENVQVQPQDEDSVKKIPKKSTIITAAATTKKTSKRIKWNPWSEGNLIAANKIN